ncbi:MAG: ABC transporter ATP-binding protein [Synergistaceae bacterium]|jgi:iron complex transport system ATP-binding protein|nr:ABC transporter ATP-binding protein [Synergistaceae bacterium]
MLCVKNLTVELAGNKILNGVSLDAPPGVVTAILGPNGCGKSTLIRTILGLVKKSSGEIIFDEKDLSLIDSMARARLCACVPQNTVFSSSYTVLESVVMGRYSHVTRFGSYGKHDYRMAEDMIARVGLEGFEGRIVTTLSGGEAARVSIARALAQDSPMILFDEPMSALDPGHSRIIARIIKELAASGRIILIAIHDVNMALDCADRLIFLKKGAIYGNIPARGIDENILLNVYDIPWEIWSTGEKQRLVVIPASSDS